MARALILSYHCIAKSLDNTLTPNNFVSPGMFRFQMWFLKKAGFTVLSINDMVKYTLGQLDVKMPVSLTFDDGYQDFYDNAYPVLRQYDYPSTVFVVSSLVGKENIWGGTKKLPVLKLMDWETLARISEGGVDIGSHTRTHPSCKAIDVARMWEEVGDSKGEIESRLGKSADVFCYPFGDYNESVIHAVKSAGYIAAVTTQRGLIEQGTNPYLMKRISIKRKTKPLSFILKVCTDYERRKEMRGALNFPHGNGIYSPIES